MSKATASAALALAGRGMIILTPNSPETGVGSYTKNREIKKGYSPINQLFQKSKGVYLMTIHRMRTIGESVEIIKEIDQDSAITANCIRSLCKDGKVHCVFTGKKILVDLDDLIKYFSGESENIA
jgi:hypothetical protein